MEKVFRIITIVLLSVAVVLSSLILAIVVYGSPQKAVESSADSEETIHVFYQTYFSDYVYEGFSHGIGGTLFAGLDDTNYYGWKTSSVYYYGKLKDYYKENDKSNGFEQMLNSVTYDQDNWERYYEKQRSYYNEFLEAAGKTDKEIAEQMAKFDMYFYRSRAIFLYELCLKLNIEVRPL